MAVAVTLLIIIVEVPLFKVKPPELKFQTPPVLVAVHVPLPIVTVLVVPTAENMVVAWILKLFALKLLFIAREEVDKKLSCNVVSPVT